MNVRLFELLKSKANVFRKRRLLFFVLLLVANLAWSVDYVFEQGGEYPIALDLSAVEGAGDFMEDDFMVNIFNHDSSRVDTIISIATAYTDTVLSVSAFVNHEDTVGFYRIEVLYAAQLIYEMDSAISVLKGAGVYLLSSDLPDEFTRNSIQTVSIESAGTFFVADTVSQFYVEGITDTTEQVPICSEISFFSNSLATFDIVVPGAVEPGYYLLRYFGDKTGDVVVDTLVVGDGLIDVGIRVNLLKPLMKGEFVEWGITGKQSSFLQSEGAKLVFVPEETNAHDDTIAFESVHYVGLNEFYAKVIVQVPVNIAHGQYRIYYYETLTGYIYTEQVLEVLDDTASVSITVSPMVVNPGSQVHAKISMGNYGLLEPSSFDSILVRNGIEEFYPSFEVVSPVEIQIRLMLPETAQLGYYDLVFYKDGEQVFESAEKLIVSRQLTAGDMEHVTSYTYYFSSYHIAVDYWFVDAEVAGEISSVEMKLIKSSGEYENFSFDESSLQATMDGIYEQQTVELVCIVTDDNGNESAFDFSVYLYGSEVLVATCEVDPDSNCYYVTASGTIESTLYSDLSDSEFLIFGISGNVVAQGRGLDQFSVYDLPVGAYIAVFGGASKGGSFTFLVD